MTTMGSRQSAVGSREAWASSSDAQLATVSDCRLPTTDSRRPQGLQLPLLPPDEIDAAASGNDRVPELTHYRDEGCRFWSACLTCPFARCLFEEPGGARHALNAARDGEIRRRYAAGEPAVAIAEQFGIARRTVYRVIGGARRHGGRQMTAGRRERKPRSRSHVPGRGA